MGVALLAFASMRRQTARCVGRPVFGLTPSGLLSATAPADVPEQGLGVEPESVRRAEEPSSSARGASDPIATAPTSPPAPPLPAPSRLPPAPPPSPHARAHRPLPPPPRPPPP